MNPSEHCYSGIYKFTNKINGKVYIGQSVNIYRRYKDHRKLLSNYLFGRALKRHGIDQFDFEVIERVDDLSKLDEREQYWMDYYKSYKKENGYNTCLLVGTRKGVPLSEETKGKISATLKKRTGEKNPFYGRKHSAETKRKFSQMRIGKPGLNKGALSGSNNPMFGQTHSDQAKKTISETHKGRVQTADHRSKNSQALKQLHLLNPERIESMIKLANKKRRRKIEQICPHTNRVVRTWECIDDIHRELGLNKYAIGGMCRGPYLRKSTGYIEGRRERLIGGFKWQYTQ